MMLCLSIGRSSNVDSIVGGVIGGVGVLIVLTLPAILLIIVVLRVLRKRGKYERQ